MNVSYPRELRPKERDALDSVLPPDRPGYNEYRTLIAGMVALAEGRRGAGNLVLGARGDSADQTSPLAPVIAYGMIETTLDRFSITVREYVGRQIDVEIVSSRGDEIPDHFEEKRRWTYSTWRPGEPSPATHQPVREVMIDSDRVFAVSVPEKRLWVNDCGTGMNHLIPITNFYNELMLAKQIRDPKVALESSLFFVHPDRYTDADLRSAFIAYNALRRKVTIIAPLPAKEPAGLKKYFKRLLVRK